MMTFTTLVALTFLITIVIGTETSLTFRIKEEEDPGSKVGNVTVRDVNLNEGGTLFYFLPSTPDGTEDESFFKLNNKTGQITTKVKIDRENISKCNYKSECSLNFKIGVPTNSGFYTVSVTVMIEDINDNSPQFKKNIFQGSFSEADKINSSFTIDQAEDKDQVSGGVNGIHGYEIHPASDMFGLKVQKKAIGEGFTVEVFMKKELDREIKGSYTITIVAIDGGNPPRTGKMDVVITVTDINDHKPKFSPSSYNVTVDEDEAPNSIILTVSATDDDIGVNGEIFYRLAEKQGNIYNDFKVDSTFGHVIIKNKLVYKSGHYYEFIVEAVDRGKGNSVGQCQVYVYVRDSKNSPPVITATFLHPFTNAWVAEDTAVDKNVAYITAIDTDSGQNGQVSCSVVHISFRIDELGNDFMVVLDKPLNREVKAQHNVTVVCSDKGSPALSSSKSFIINVQDVNDNAPEFKKSNYEGQMYENNKQDVVDIVQVSASDNDIGKNKEIHYKINKEQSTVNAAELNKIFVNPSNGFVYVKGSFDREVTPQVIFEVLAIDSGKIALTGTATVTLTIKDVNDNPPRFTLSAYQFNVIENSISGTSVGKFTAKDNDIGDNGKFTFALSSEYINQKLPFTIFANGEIKTNRALDREEKSRYDFRVTVTDQGSPSESNSVQVVVLVQDMNDNHPNVTFPRKGNNSVNVLYPDVPSDFSIQIEAYDIDDGENKTLTYSIKSGNELGLFAIDFGTGNIVVVDRSVVIEHDLTIHLQIQVSDQGIERLSSEYELIVKVVFSNATYSSVKGGSDNKYVIISVVVVVLTILISAVIISVIILLRKIDRKKNLRQSQKKSDSNSEFQTKPTLFIINNSSESHTDGVSPATELNPKKKEVSFSLDDQNSIVNFQQQPWRSTSIPEPVKYAPEKPPRKDGSRLVDDTGDHAMYDKVTTRLENFKLQQLLMETRAKQNVQATQHSNPEDSRSETSGETTTCDSGRGASDEELPSTSPSHDDPKMFTYPASLNNYGGSNNRSSLPSSSTASRNNHRLSPPPIPSRTYKPYSSFSNNDNQPISCQNYVSNPSYIGRGIPSHNTPVLPQQQYQPHSQYPINLNTTAQSDFLDFSSLPSNFRDSFKSRDDDEYSTTTSGSYTLYTGEDL